MEFRPDDTVVHPSYGVGCILRVGPRQFDTRREQDYYEIAIAGGTVWVAVEDPDHGLRRVTRRGDLAKYRRLLRGRPGRLTSDTRQRKIDLDTRMKQATFGSRCEVFRDLWAQRSIRPLDERSNALLRRAQGLVCSEWAEADGSTLEEAMREVEALVVEGQELHGIGMD